MEKNSERLLRERASAEVLRIPATCRAERDIPYTAQKKKRERSRRISCGSLAEPLFNANTTAMLSQ